MGPRRFSKYDVQFHSDFNGPLNAAVNVKIHRWEDPDLAAVAADLGFIGEDAAAFSASWEALDEQERSEWGNLAIEDGWRRLGEAAREIFGAGAEVYSEGRSGGWATVAPDGRHCYTAEDVVGWDALAVSRWGRFVAACRATVADLPYMAAWLYGANAWEPEREELERVRRFSFYYDAPGEAAEGGAA